MAQRFMGNRESILDNAFALESSGFFPVSIQINCTGAKLLSTGIGGQVGSKPKAVIQEVRKTIPLGHLVRANRQTGIMKTGKS